jgi:hypothetical protein
MPSVESIETHGGFLCTIILVILTMMLVNRTPPLAALDTSAPPETTTPTKDRWRSAKMPALAILFGISAAVVGIFTFISIPVDRMPDIDSQVSALQSKVATLSAAVSDLKNVQLLQVCNENLSVFDIKSLKNLRAAVDADIVRPEMHLGGSGPRSAWFQTVGLIQSLAKKCLPHQSFGFVSEPSPELMDNATPGEPSIETVGVDVVRKVRRFGVDPIRPDTRRVGKGCTPGVSDSPAGSGDARCCSPPSTCR